MQNLKMHFPEQKLTMQKDFELLVVQISFIAMENYLVKC
jgi:hypothetical protein